MSFQCKLCEKILDERPTEKCSCGSYHFDEVMTYGCNCGFKTKPIIERIIVPICPNCGKNTKMADKKNSNPSIKEEPKPKYRFPRFARLILGQYNAYLVGSAADPNNEDPRDYDIVVAWEDWKHVAMLIPKDATITLFGGFKVESDGKVVDIWPDTLTSAIECAKTKYISNPFKGIEIEIKKTGKEQT